ncbi:hypothetical protein [Candidatus Poriferisodalis sp.]|uniref:hypothetical protein n=1 Tax=Candidatus Poriferisodalis sp. TaxID=3101277 RepID=UPI003B023CFA
MLIGMPGVLLFFVTDAIIGGPAHSVPALASLFALMGTGSMGFSFFREHGWGTWDRLRVAPIRTIHIVGGKAVPMLGTMAVAGAGGAIAQLAALPGWVQAIAPASPVYWAIDAYRSVLTGEQGFGRAIAMLLGFGMLFTVVTLWQFRAEKPKESFLGE